MTINHFITKFKKKWSINIVDYALLHLTALEHRGIILLTPPLIMASFCANKTKKIVYFTDKWC